MLHVFAFHVIFFFKILEKFGSVKAPDQVNLYNRNGKEVISDLNFLLCLKIDFLRSPWGWGKRRKSISINIFGSEFDDG